MADYDKDLFERTLKNGLSELHRYRRKRVYAVTGEGYLKSKGVKDLQKIRKHERKAGVAGEI